jgi:hypothetical protein
MWLGSELWWCEVSTPVFCFAWYVCYLLIRDRRRLSIDMPRPSGAPAWCGLPKVIDFWDLERGGRHQGRDTLSYDCRTPSRHHSIDWNELLTSTGKKQFLNSIHFHRTTTFSPGGGVVWGNGCCVPICVTQSLPSTTLQTLVRVLHRANLFSFCTFCPVLSECLTHLRFCVYVYCRVVTGWCAQNWDQDRVSIPLPIPLRLVSTGKSSWFKARVWWHTQ